MSIWKTIRPHLKDAASLIIRSLAGLAIAAVGAVILYGEIFGTAEKHTTHLMLGVGVFGFGLAVFVPGVIFPTAKRVIVLAVDARRDGLRWTDPKSGGGEEK